MFSIVAYRSLFSILLVALIGFAAQILHAEQPTDVARLGLNGSDLGPQTALLFDPSETIDATEADRISRAGGFSQVGGNKRSFGWLSGAVWLRWSVHNSSQVPVAWILEVADAYAGQVTLYVADEAGVHLVGEGGAALPFAVRPFDFQHPAFPLLEPASSTRTYYLRAKSENRLVLPLHAWQPSSFAGSASRFNLYVGLHFGILVALIAYNLFLLRSTRDRSFAYYVLYLSAYLGAQITFFGVGQQILWPTWPEFNTRVLHFFAGLGLASGLLFSMHFLGTRSMLPRIDKALRTGVGISLLLAALAPWLPVPVSGRATNLIFAFTPIVVLAGALRWRAGFLPARYFTVAWIFLVGGLFIHSLTSIGLLSPSQLTHWATSIGASIEAILLSLALGYRLQLLEAENRHVAQLAQTDTLSGLLNRRGLDRQVQAVTQRRKEGGGSTSLMLCDIDHFKHINDTYGHDAGDAAIRHMSTLLLEVARECDSVARVGGEEFVVLMPNTNLAGATVLAERVRDVLQNCALDWKGERIAMTTSIGVTEFSADREEALGPALARADAGLYRAKNSGRNRVETSVAE